MTLTPPPCLFTSRDRDVTSGSYSGLLTTKERTQNILTVNIIYERTSHN